MIKKFKIFEGYNDNDDIISLLNDDDIEDLWSDRYYYDDVEEIFKMNVKHNLNFVNGDSFLTDIISDQIDNYNVDDFDDYDFKNWIKDNIKPDIKEEVLKIYIKNNYSENDVTSDVEYDDSLLDELDENELKNIIVDLNYEGNFVEDTIRSRYENYDIYDYLDDYYGRDYDKYANEIYNTLSYYIDENKMVEDFNNNEDFDYKKETISNDIEYNIDIQKAIIEKDNYNILKLAKYLSNNNSTHNIMDEYEYQKMYIEEYAKKKSNKKQAENAKAKALKFINDEFKLDSNIEDEYIDDMWMVNAANFNL